MFQLLFTHTPLLYLTQSFWRDEAFSALSAEHSLGFIVSKLGFEPPLYYTLLHYWIRIFGESDIAVRVLSVVGFGLACWVMIEWAGQMYKKHWLSWYLPLIFFLNPMLLYYAFEARTYAWYTFFGTAMLYAYTNKRWVIFTIAAVLGFYTHVYLLLFIGALFIHWLVTERPNITSVSSLVKRNRVFQSFLTIGVLMIPWLVKIASETARLKSSWYFPIGNQLIWSLLGNMFTGYEGTPWYGWQYTAYLSLFLVAFGVLALTDRKFRKQTVLYILFGLIPLAVIIGISFIKPLFVNRYLIPATVAEVLIVAAGIAAIKNQSAQKITAAIVLIFLVWINWWFPPQHPKAPIRETLIQINTLVKPTDVIMADNPLIYLETLFYAKNRAQVYLYNPDKGVFPWYIGDALITPSRMKTTYPVYPIRAFVVHTDTTFDVAYQMPETFKQSK